MSAAGRRQGMALLSVLLALMILGALAAAAVVLLLEEGREAESSRFDAAADGAAESRAVGEVEAWTGRGDLGGSLFLVSAIARGADSVVPWAGASARVGLLVRFDSLPVPEAALIAVGGVSLSLGASVEADSVGGTEAGVPVVSDSAFDSTGNALFAHLARDTASGAVVHIGGDAHLRGGGGAGVLLVDGSLQIDSAFTFRGLVLSRGALVLSGSSTDAVQLYGTVITLSHVTVGSGVRIKYDKVLIDSMLRAEIHPEVISSRAWIRLF